MLPSAAQRRRALAGPILRSQNPFGLSVEWLRFFSMNSDGESKPEPVDPEMLVRMLEIEMIQKRAARQQASARRNTWRAASFLFLFIVILAVGFALYYVFSSGRLDEMRSHNGPPATATPASSPAR